MNTARQKGGLALQAKNGADHYRNIGKLGGRPPLKSLSQQLAERQGQASEVPDGAKGGKRPRPSLKELRGLFFERRNNGKSQYPA